MIANNERGCPSQEVTDLTKTVLTAAVLDMCSVTKEVMSVAVTGLFPASRWISHIVWRSGRERARVCIYASRTGLEYLSRDRVRLLLREQTVGGRLRVVFPSNMGQKPFGTRPRPRG